MRAALLLPLALAGCISAPSTRALRAGPAFVPERVFVGCLHGEGRLRRLLGDPRDFRVDSEGRRLPDGTLVLDQRVEMGRDPITRRQWRLRPVGNGRWRGTLAEVESLAEDAAPPPGRGQAVRGVTRGNAFHLRYGLSGPLGVRQSLFLQPDGTVQNRMTVTAPGGLVVARLSEEIGRRPCE